jgi:hypothetical protein
MTMTKTWRFLKYLYFHSYIRRTDAATKVQLRVKSVFRHDVPHR